MAGLDQIQAILTHRGQGLFMGFDHAGEEVLQSRQGHEPLAHLPLTDIVNKFLIVEIKRGLLLPLQNTLLLPEGEIGSGTAVTVVAAVVSRKLLAEHQPNDIEGAAGIQRLLQGGRNGIIGGRDHLGGIANQVEIVTQPAERGNFGHEQRLPGYRKIGLTIRNSAPKLQGKKGI